MLDALFPSLRSITATAILLLLLLLLLLLGLTVGNVTRLQPISLGHNEPFGIFSWVAHL